jgi:pectate lyase
MYYEAGCGDTRLATDPNARFNPLLNLNSNIDNSSGSETGSNLVVENCDFDIRGALFSGYELQNVINISGTVDNITVLGKYPSKPVTGPSGLITVPNIPTGQNRPIRCDGSNKTITIEGVRITGEFINNGLTPISIAPSTNVVIRNSVLNNLTVTTGVVQTDNITNAAYEALP